MKLEINDFSGDLHPKAFVDWLNSLDDYFVNKYIEGLHLDIRQRISMFDFNDINEAYYKAHKAQHKI